METASHIKVIPEQANPSRSLRVLFNPGETLLLVRLFKAVCSPIDRKQSASVLDSSDYETKTGNVNKVEVGFRFLKSNNAAPFAIRLAAQLAEAASAIRRDPLAFIAVRSKSNAISSENRKRMRTGVAVAVVFYTVVLS